MKDQLRDAALEYHRSPPAGKLAVVPTKPLANQRDLALAYSPGVAAACELVASDPATASQVTGRGNLVAVVTNGTAVLGLGPIGPLAAKPVMEGKAVLFKTFAGIDVFDIEIDEPDPLALADVIARLEPTFGAINLEDIKAPDCFEVEDRLRQRMRIPVFHDDQHGTAIIVAAAVQNGLRLVDKQLADVRLVTSGAGAAALACLDLLVELGLPVDNITVTDIDGVVRVDRRGMHPRMARYARDTDATTLAEVIAGADIFLGLSAPNVVSGEMVATMAPRPLVFALANPGPEVLPEQVREVRSDAIIATGRSDYPNQVNNVLCFPFIFRGALDVGATAINQPMKVACVEALAELARAESSEVAAKAYGGQHLSFGPDYIIPRPFDPRLLVEIAPAVARAAMDSGVASRPVDDLEAYRERLGHFVWRTGLLMKNVFDAAEADPRRLVYAEGEEPQVLRAVQTVVDERLARPILIGRRSVVAMRIERLGLRLRMDEDFELVDPQNDPRYREYWTEYHRIMERRGVTPEYARTVVRTRTTVIAALMVRRREAEAMLCGTVGRFRAHLKHVMDVIGQRAGVTDVSTVNAVVLPRGVFFLSDTQVTADPTADEMAQMAVLGADVVRRFDLEPRIALLSHSSFGSADTPSAAKMRQALELIRQRAPELEIEGEMQADAAVDEAVRLRLFPSSRLRGAANMLLFPTLDAANIALNLLRSLGEGLSLGPILVGPRQPAHVLTPTTSVRNIVNMSALAVVEAQSIGRET